MGRLGVKANYPFFDQTSLKQLNDNISAKNISMFYFVEVEETNLKLNINLSKHFVSSEESF